MSIAPLIAIIGWSVGVVALHYGLYDDECYSSTLFCTNRTQNMQ